jgi:hypothetical protein
MPLKVSNKILDVFAQIVKQESPKTVEKQLPEMPDEELEMEKPTKEENKVGDVSDSVEEFDKEQIKASLASVDDLKEVVNARGDLFMTVNTVRGYKVALQYADGNIPTMPELNRPENKKKRLEEVFIFVYSDPSPAVIEFLVSTAQSNNFKKILGFTDHAVIVTEYRL